MIRVDRSRVPNPFAPGSNLERRAVEERRRIEALMLSGNIGQSRPDFRVIAQPEVRDALHLLFHNKCAYCETPLVSGPGDIEQYRPKAAVTEAPTHLGYWWLASEWSNLLLACADCNRQRWHSDSDGQKTIAGKNNRFPLADEDKRAYSPNDDLWAEQPLLLNPTIDDPASHLVYGESGELFSKTERGNATISILGLNRSYLVQARSRTLQAFFVLMKDIIDKAEDGQRVSDADVRRIKVARQQDEYLRNGISQNTNVLIKGDRGAGKTFLLRSLQIDLTTERAKIFPVFVKTFQAITSQGSGSFLSGYILQELCTGLWKHCFDGNYSRLLDLSVRQKRTLKDDFDPAARKFADIYAVIQSRQMEARGAFRSLLGGATLAKAEIGSEHTSSVVRGGLLPFEFTELLGEILDICSSRSNLTPLLICDEVNLISLEMQRELLISCFDVFNSKGVRFVCSVDQYDWANIPIVADSFGCIVDLNAAPQIDLAGPFLANHFGNEADHFGPDLRAILFEFFGGHPRSTLAVCRQLINGFREQGQLIDTKSVTKTCMALLKHRGITPSAVATTIPDDGQKSLF